MLGVIVPDHLSVVFDGGGRSRATFAKANLRGGKPLVESFHDAGPFADRRMDPRHGTTPPMVSRRGGWLWRMWRGSDRLHRRPPTSDPGLLHQAYTVRLLR